MIRRIRNWFFPQPAHTPNLPALANCPECLAFIRSSAGVRLAKHLACQQTGHGMDAEASAATMAHVVLLIDKHSAPMRKQRQEAR